MQQAYLVQFDGPEIPYEERLRLKETLGAVIRGTAFGGMPVSVDHLGLPISDLSQRTEEQD